MGSTPLHQITLAHRLYRNLELEEDKGESPDIETLIQVCVSLLLSGSSNGATD